MNQKLEIKQRESINKEETKDHRDKITTIDKYRNNPNLQIKDFALNEEIKENSKSSLSENSFRVVVRTSINKGLSKTDSDEKKLSDESSQKDQRSSDRDLWIFKVDKEIWLNHSYWINEDTHKSKLD